MIVNLLKFFPLILDIWKRILRLFNISREKFFVRETRKKSRTYLTANTTLQLNGDAKTEAQKVSKQARELIKKHIDNPEELLDFIKFSGTQVIRANYINIVLFLLGESEGFITPSKGLKSLLISVIINILSKDKVKIGFKTPAMFIITNSPINLYFFAHQLHHWLAYKKGLPGYDEETMNNFKNIWKPDFISQDINKLSIDDILALKDAIARDIEAIDFVKEISRELIGSKNSIARIKKGESVNL